MQDRSSYTPTVKKQSLISFSGTDAGVAPSLPLAGRERQNPKMGGFYAGKANGTGR